MVETAAGVREVLHTVLDPEMPISIVDLGIVHDVHIAAAPDKPDAQQVTVDITPTFLGCPALDMIRDRVVEALSPHFGEGCVTVRYVNAPAWSVDKISDAGRARLREFGVTVPDRGSMCGHDEHPDAPTKVQLTVSARQEKLACPFCGSFSTTLESPFGPTRCKMIYYCEACRNSFEHLKHI